MWSRLAQLVDLFETFLGPLELIGNKIVEILWELLAEGVSITAHSLLLSALHLGK